MNDKLLGCCCKGNSCCGPNPAGPAIGRRDFLKTAAAAGGIALAASGVGTVAVPAEAAAAADEALRAWNAGLLERGARRVYRGRALDRVAVPMGGIGAGQVYLTGRGTLEHWQIVNNFNSKAETPGSLFALWTRTGDGAVRATLLRQQDDTDGPLPQVPAVNFSSEYPFAWIDYRDDGLPVSVALEAFSPFIPLQADDSGLPAVLFRFTVRNLTETPVEAALMAAAPNLAGWDGYAPLDGGPYVDYLHNENGPIQVPGATAIAMTTRPGDLHRLAESRTLFTNDRLVAQCARLCENLDVFFEPHLSGDRLGEAPVFWIGDVSARDAQGGLSELLDRVKAGATAIVAGDSRSLLALAGEEAAATAWREALPVDVQALRREDHPAGIAPDTGLPAGAVPGDTVAGPRWTVPAEALKPETRVLLQAADGAALVVEGPCGDGRLVVCAGDVLRWIPGFDRKAFVGHMVAHGTGTAYRPQTGWPQSSPFHGSMALAVIDGDSTVTARPQWRDRHSLWTDFADDGRLDPDPGAQGPSEPGHTWNAALSASLSLDPGEEKSVTFLLAWHFPNRMRDWRYGLGPADPQYDHRLGNWYNTRFDSAAAVAEYAIGNLGRLEGGTRAFHRAFHDSTLPQWFLDSVTANMSTLRSPILMRLEDGTFAGFEGTDACCPMNCTHVYNYAMSAAFLFPELERRVREIDLLLQKNPEEHFIPHRTLLPLSLPRLGNEIAGPFHHALDGELGTVLKAYREWRQCGDRDWLASLWPGIVDVMRHVFRDHDTEGDGVIRGEQPNTYDTHAYGSNTFIGSLYLAALRATEAMAQVSGDDALAGECRDRFTRGSRGYDRICWNGEYYINAYDAPGVTPEMYEDENCWGPGCLSDQLLGQWWAHITGLGHLLPPDRVRQALRSIHRYNWLTDFRAHAHNQRVFAEGEEKGLLNCSWPRGGRPQKPIRYCDEVWTGIEYEVAALLLWEGWTLEGLQVAKAARDRYTGDQRNPWSEEECGGHYARAMASYSLLLAASGADVDAGAASLGFAPRLMPDDFKSFFSTGHCWGSLAQRRQPGEQANRVSVDFGTMALELLKVERPPHLNAAPRFEVSGPGSPRIREWREIDGMYHLRFDPVVTLGPGQHLEVRVRHA